ncbi:membrane protein [Novosphingobium barchaimii LL02]|uniref:17 kDa surface antigen n=1 Tax=Novosphingobium barchaimii LL02 TaxID=1114963 RepID=A0A0J8A6A5_9SPHN|nr:glycine zipper 2TM domain-containing protein [Novosphingobium barchaimii]KMS50915.1 membrane protein [Novosphingobium barchaimii LL02]
MNKSLLALAALAFTATALPLTPAMADPPRWNDRDRDGRNDRWDRRDNRKDYRRDDRRRNIYDSRGRYSEPRRIDRNSHVWRGNDGRYYCKRDNGTTGLIIGAGVGALAGNQIAGNGDRTIGTILGGVLGGALGREIDKGDIQCR